MKLVWPCTQKDLPPFSRLRTLNHSWLNLSKLFQLLYEQHPWIPGKKYCYCWLCNKPSIPIMPCRIPPLLASFRKSGLERTCINGGVPFQNCFRFLGPTPRQKPQFMFLFFKIHSCSMILRAISVWDNCRMFHDHSPYQPLEVSKESSQLGMQPDYLKTFER